MGVRGHGTVLDVNVNFREAQVAFELDLSGRTVLVTGGGQGVGRAIALAFGAAGARVCVNDIRGGRAEEASEEVRALGGAASPAPFDVTDYRAVADGVAAAGPVDVLVNNAGNAGAEGFAGLGPFAASDPADWDRYIRVNLYGVLHCTRAVLPGMESRSWGRVITIVSDAGRTGDANTAVYGAAKAGAAAFTRTVAVEGGRHNITANNIALGTMRTPATEGMWADPDSERTKATLRRYVIRRPGLPEDVAPLAVFLASSHADWITGQTYPVNGGYSFAL